MIGKITRKDITRVKRRLTRTRNTARRRSQHCACTCGRNWKAVIVWGTIVWYLICHCDPRDRWVSSDETRAHAHLAGCLSASRWQVNAVNRSWQQGVRPIREAAVSPRNKYYVELTDISLKRRFDILGICRTSRFTVSRDAALTTLWSWWIRLRLWR